MVSAPRNGVARICTLAREAGRLLAASVSSRRRRGRVKSVPTTGSEIGDKIDVNSHLARCSRRRLLPGGLPMSLPFSVSVYLVVATFSLALFPRDLPFRRKRREREERVPITGRRNARGATAATTSCRASEDEGKGSGGGREAIRERSARSSHKQLVASAKLPRLLRRSSNSSRVCSSPRLYHLSARMAWVGASMRRM